MIIKRVPASELTTNDFRPMSNIEIKRKVEDYTALIRELVEVLDLDEEIAASLLR